MNLPTSGWVRCPSCEGNVWEQDAEHKCPTCDGIGKITAAYARSLAGGGHGFMLLADALPKRPAAPEERPCVGCGAPCVAPWVRCEPCQERLAEEYNVQMAQRRLKAWTERMERWWAISGVPPRFLPARFASFQRDGNGESVAAAYDAALSWAEGWDWRKPTAQPGLMLYSTLRGSGKTHLLAAMCWRALERCQPSLEELTELERNRESSKALGGPASCPVRCWKADALLLRVGQSRRPVRFDQEGPRQETEEEVYAGLAEVRLLAIDDLGEVPNLGDEIKQVPVWEKIITERYNANLPILVTTNLDPMAELQSVVGPRAMSRLQEMLEFQSVNGLRDWRAKVEE